MLTHALSDLSAGKAILLYDLDEREQETDMVIAGSAITPDHVAALRSEAGGLICAAIPGEVAAELGLPYLHEVLKKSGFETLRRLSSSPVPYGGSPAFSITVNHRETYTGITDVDRSKTIRELSNLVAEVVKGGAKDWASVMAERFRSPGHVHILISSPLGKRRGHTELSLRLAELAGLDPVMVVCEMLDPSTHKALTKESAKRYARRHGLAFVEATEVLREAGVA